MILERLKALRGLMRAEGLDVYLVPTADEHLNEYLAAHLRRREAVSGFTGSAGEVAVCLDEAHLFVDSRYHIQAGAETPADLFTLHKTGLEGEQELKEWLSDFDQRKGPLEVGLDPFLVTIDGYRKLAEALDRDDSRLHPMVHNLVDQVWRERPVRERRQLYSLPLDITGEEVGSKLARIREWMAVEGAGALVLTRLDEVAWLTNLRGGDIPHNPLFEAYLVVGEDHAHCYTDAPLTKEIKQSLEGLVDFHPPEELAGGIAAEVVGIAHKGSTLWLDGEGSSEGVRLLAGEAELTLTSPNPVTAMKAVKNPVEIEAIGRGHLKAGRAKVRAFSRLSGRLAAGEKISEADFAGMLEEEYASEEGYSDLSFATISAFGANAAMVHYGAPDSGSILEPGGMLLVDSGIQALGATTDDTRTIAIGAPSPKQRRHYTDVLRAHIGLARQIFPEGTRGRELDAIARSPLWNAGTDYGHGTGHGVGAFLNVHEGPQNINPRGAVALEPGMVVSNEPGYYQAGWGGIRLENLYVVEEMLGLPPHPGGKRWLRFSPLTMIPFDQKLIEEERLTREEAAWLADYHDKVLETLSPGLEEPHRQWLEQACRPAG